MGYTLHNLSKHPLYRAYSNMMRRCYDSRNVAYHHYGGKGVTVCPEWKNDFMAFYNWALSNGWRRGLHIDKDKIPKELGIPAIIYSPQTCSIISPKENGNIISTNIILEYLGRKQTLSQWTEELGLNYDFIWQRLRMGWSAQKALSTPKRSIQEINADKRALILNTQTGIFYFGTKEAADSIGISVSYLNGKLIGRHVNNTSLMYV